MQTHTTVAGHKIAAPTMPLHRSCIPLCLLALIFFAHRAYTESDGVEEKVRIVTKEELARHDGNQTEGVYWLSIMSKVFDVSKGTGFYGKGGPYSVFVGRDANVPFITGTFNEEEAAKSLIELTPHQVMSLETWTDFYDKEEKYPFIGLLEGELYDSEGKPTEMMGKVQEMIAEGKVAAEAQKQKTREVIARRKLKDAEKKARLAAQGEKPIVKPPPKTGYPRVIESLEVEEARTAEETARAKAQADTEL